MSWHAYRFIYVQPLRIVPEGEGFCIAFRGEVIIHGLDAKNLAKAQEVVAILNSVPDESEEAG